MDRYGLHDRQRRLLYLLNCEHGVVTGKELARKLGISERTVRNDIAEINEKLAAYKLEILATRGKGYFLKVGSRKVFHELFSDKASVQTREDRIKSLILRLVRAPGWCDVPQLEDDMFVSHTTLENDLKEIRQRITYNEPYLALIRKGNAIRLDDDEIKRRNIMVRIYSENWDYDSRDGIILKDREMSPEILDRLRKVWKSALRKNHLELDDFGLIYMIMASAVAHARIAKGHGLPEAAVLEGAAPQDTAAPEGAAPQDTAVPEGASPQDTAVPEGTPKMLTESTAPPHAGCPAAFPAPQADITALKAKLQAAITMAVDMFWQKMAPEWGVEDAPPEHRWLEDILRQLIILNFDSENKAVLAQMAEDRAKDYARVLLEELYTKVGLDFRSDAAFCTDLVLHIQALINRMVSVQAQSKYMIGELRLRYPYLGAVVHELCGRLEEQSGQRMGGDARDYLLPLMVAAWKRLARENTKNELRAVLVSHLNDGLSHGLLDELRTRFGTRMQVLGPFPIYDRKRIDEVGPSLIITTTRMDAFRKYAVPVLTVSPFMEDGDVRSIEHCLDRLVKKLMFPDPPRGTDYFRHKRLELTVERRMELPEILSFIEENLRGNLFVSELLTIDWSRCYYTLLSEQCLFVSMVGAFGQETVLASACCKYVTAWRQNRNIRKVIFMVIHEKERCYLGSFYRLMEEEV